MVDDDSLQTMAKLWDLFSTSQRWRVITVIAAGAAALLGIGFWFGSVLSEGKLEKQAAQYERQISDLRRQLNEIEAPKPAEDVPEVEERKEDIPELSEAPSLKMTLAEFRQAWLKSKLDGTDFAKPYCGKSVVWHGWVVDVLADSDQIEVIMAAEKDGNIPRIACYFDSNYKYSAGVLREGHAVTVAGVLAESKKALFDFALYKCDLYQYGSSHDDPPLPE